MHLDYKDEVTYTFAYWPWVIVAVVIIIALKGCA